MTAVMEELKRQTMNTSTLGRIVKNQKTVIQMCCPCDVYIANSECVDKTGEYQCHCKSGYMADDRGMNCIKHTKLCDCRSGWYVVNNELCVRGKLGDPCDIDPDCYDALNNTVCSPDTKLCDCRSGWYVVNNEYCVRRTIGDPCDIDPDCYDALNNSVCSPDTSSCDCRSGWYVVNNEYCVQMTTSSVMPNPKKEPNTLNLRLIAVGGGPVAGVILIVVVAVVAWRCRRSRRRSSTSNSIQTESTHYEDVEPKIGTAPHLSIDDDVSAYERPQFSGPVVSAARGHHPVISSGGQDLGEALYEDIRGETMATYNNKDKSRTENIINTPSQHNWAPPDSVTTSHSASKPDPPTKPAHLTNDAINQYDVIAVSKQTSREGERDERSSSEYTKLNITDLNVANQDQGTAEFCVHIQKTNQQPIYLNLDEANVSDSV